MRKRLSNTQSRRLLEAEGRDTLPERLEEMAREFVGYSGDGRYAPPIRPVEPGERRALGAALAANPNTPPRVLAHLAGSYPVEFCRNPVTPLLVLEGPEFVDWLGHSNLSGLLRRADLPGPVAGAIAGYAREPLLREEASLHINLAGELSPDSWRDALIQFLRGKRAGLRPEARRVLDARIERGEVPAWMADEEAGTEDKDGDTRELRHRSGPLTSPWQEENREVLRESLLSFFVRLRPNITGQMAIDFLRQDRDDWWRRLAAALNPDMRNEPDILAILCEDGNRFVRAAARATRAGETGLL